MRRFANAAVLLLLSGAAAPLAAQAPDAHDVDAIFAQWSSPFGPGCAVAAELDGRTVLSRAYGMADLEHAVPNQVATIFEAGSVSKQFTAAAIILLALEGALALDDDVRRFVPELPDYGEPVTIRHLLHHTSGLRDWGSVAAISGWGRSDRAHDHDHVVDILSRQTALNYPPGEAYSYTNSGYNLMAVIVERISGSSFADFSRERIFEPLGLRDTQWRDDYRRVVQGRATAYATRGGDFIIDRPNEFVHGNGGLLTTVADLLRWDAALRGGELGGPELVRLMHEEGVLNDGSPMGYAGGLQIGTRRGVPQVSHTGATGGYRAFLGRYPEQGLTVALLCNIGAANPGGLGGQVVDLFLEQLVPEYASAATSTAIEPPEPAIDVPAAALAARAGLYRDVATGEPLELLVDGDELRVQGGPRLLPLSSDAFRWGTTDRELHFVAAAPGERASARSVSGDASGTRVDALYEPVEPFSPGPDDLAEYLGAFHSDDAETTFAVRERDGSLVLVRRPGSTFNLAPVYRDVFRSPLGLVRFHRDASGTVTEFGLRQARVHDIRFLRLD